MSSKDDSRESYSVRVRLPGRPPASLLRPIAPETNVHEVADELFAYLGVDPRAPDADFKMWLRLASCIFPMLATPPTPAAATKRRGAPRKSGAKSSPEACRRIADAYDAFIEAERKHGGTPNKGRLFDKFRKANRSLFEPFMKGKGDAEIPISFATFEKKLRIGRFARTNVVVDRPIKERRLSKEAGPLYDALDYAHMKYSTPIAGVAQGGLTYNLYAVALKQELVDLDESTEAGRRRLGEIKAEVESMVPVSVSLGMVRVRPYWRREKADE